ncbi:MAG: GNAT family N-acetyltransferase [Bacteroidales bacterium]|nr:GNAT family N-acetyltransferase [Bacteroidales bacterium]
MILREISASEYESLTPQINTGTVLTHGCNPALNILIENIFDFPASFFSLEDDGNPIALIGGNRIRNRMVSTPHFSYGNIRISLTSPISGEAIFKMFVQKFSAVEWRDFKEFSNRILTYKVSSWLALEPEISSQWNVFPADLKRKINKAGTDEFQAAYIRQSNDSLTQKKLIGDFFRVYRKNLKRLGSPHLPERFFQMLVQRYQGGQLYGIVLYRNQQPVAGAINLGYGNFVENNWFASDWELRSQYISYRLNWLLIQEAIIQHFGIYSFGRSTKDSGVHRYKKQWNTYDVPLVWSYTGSTNANPRRIPDLSGIWKSLPDWVTNFAGPILAKYLY